MIPHPNKDRVCIIKTIGRTHQTRRCVHLQRVIHPSSHCSRQVVEQKRVKGTLKDLAMDGWNRNTTRVHVCKYIMQCERVNIIRVLLWVEASNERILHVRVFDAEPLLTTIWWQPANGHACIKQSRQVHHRVASAAVKVVS